MLPNAELLNLPSDDLRALARSGTEDLESLFARMWEAIRSANLYGGQPRTAISGKCVQLAEIALELAEKHKKLFAEAWSMMAYSLSANEQSDKAVDYYARALKRFEEEGQFERAARTRIGYVAALFNADRYDEALKEAGSAEEWFRRNNDEIGYARLCTNIANLYQRLDDHLMAYRYHLNALDIFRKVDDRKSLAQSCLNIANALTSIDEFEQADQMFETSELLSLEDGLTTLWAQAKYNRAYLHYLRGRYSDALQAFSKLRREFQQSGSRRHAALCQLDEAEIYVQLNLSAEAAELALRASREFEALRLNYERAKAAAFYGMALVQMRRFSDAVTILTDAERILAGDGNLYWGAAIKLYRAEVHLLLKQHTDARLLAMEAKEVFDALEVPSKRMLALVLLGRIALGMGNVEDAAGCRREIAALEKNTTVPLLLFPCHVLSAEIALRLGRLDHAMRYYELAADDLERHQVCLPHDELRVTFFSGRHQVYEALVRLLLDQGKDAEAVSSAYSWCERAKSRALIELLSHCRPAKPQPHERSLATRIRRIREELNNHYVRTHPQSGVTSLSDFDAIAAKEKELKRALRELAVIDPECASLQQVSVATADCTREFLPDGSTLIEYFVADEEVLAFVLSRDGITVTRRLSSVSRIANIREWFRFQLDKVRSGQHHLGLHSEQLLKATRRHLHALYQDLVEPLQRNLRTERLIIVPHGILHLLPFHAMYDGREYLMDKFEISYAPSASVLKYCLEKDDIIEGSPLLVGVADDNAPFINDEISGLEELLPDSRVLRGSNATREAFIEYASAATIVHIATHAMFREDNPMFSSFKLSDRWITAMDLFSIRCPANLVTLSSCDSAVIEVSGGDDLLGLIRGFLYAGARSLLLSLWPVDDASTAALMRRFYRHYIKCGRKAGALRTAMREQRMEQEHPFYWAPFVLIGKT